MTQGNPEQAQALCDRFDVPFPCLADPALDSYRAFELKRGSAVEVMGPAAMLNWLRAARKGHFVERAIGDVFQMPGTFIIDAAGVIRYAKYARNSGDHPKTQDLLDALHELSPPEA